MSDVSKKYRDSYVKSKTINGKIKCPKCSRKKRVGLFSKRSIWCKSCHKKWMILHRANMKQVDFASWKAKSLRSNWLQRCKKYNRNIKEVPSIAQIKEWLIKTAPYICFYSGKDLGRQFGVDHKMPLIRGGSFGFENLCISDTMLNGAKGKLTDSEFFELLNLIKNWEDKGDSLLRRLNQGHF